MDFIYLCIITMFIPIAFAAQLKVTMSDVQGFPEGSDALLACDYTPTNALGVDITWKRFTSTADIVTLVLRNDVDEEYTSRMALEVPNNFQGKAGLRISDVTKEDAMFYTCEVFSTDSSSDTKSTVFSVQWNYKPKITSDPDTTKSLQVGDNVTLTCVTDANPVPVVSWLMDNVTFEMDERFTINENASTLHIDGVTSNDHALFSCCSTNPANEIRSDQIELDVEYKPEVYLNQTENIVQCVSHANPDVYQYEFKIDDDEQRNNEEIYQLKGTECVNITCFATNAIGTGNASDIVCPIDEPKPTSLPITGLSGGAVAGIVIGCLVLVGAITVLVIIVLVKGKSGTYGEPKDSKWEYAKDNKDVHEEKKQEKSANSGNDMESGNYGTDTAGNEEKPKDHRYDEPPADEPPPTDEAKNKDWV